MNFKKIGTIIFLLFMSITLFYYFNIGSYFEITAIKDRMIQMYHFVQLRYTESVLIYIAVFTAIIACAIPAMPILSITGGYLFGAKHGLLYSQIGCLLGATASFFAVRYIIKETVHHRYRVQLERFKEKIHEQGVTSYLLMMQFISIIPFFIINTLAALADVPFFTFFWTTLIGSFPMLFVYTLAGKQLGSIESINDLFSPSVILMLVVLIVLSVVPIIVKKLKTDRS